MCLKILFFWEIGTLKTTTPVKHFAGLQPKEKEVLLGVTTHGHRPCRHPPLRLR